MPLRDLRGTLMPRMEAGVDGGFSEPPRRRRFEIRNEVRPEGFRALVLAPGEAVAPPEAFLIDREFARPA